MGRPRTQWHRKTGTPIYATWSAMVQRCTNPKNPNYPNYGGRGIGVCERWLVFANFLADMGERPAGYTLERINNEKGYVPGNCEWIPKGQQTRNRRTTKMTPDLVRQIRQRAVRGNYSALAREYGVTPETVRNIADRRTWRNIEQ